jgi:Uma2 family endonuclease
MSIASEKPQLSGYGQPTWDVARLFPAQGCWTEEDYLELKPNRWVEFSHGFVEFLATPTLTHQLAALYLYRTLESFVSTQQLGTALAGPYRVRLWEGKYREPDILFVGAKHASRLTENYCRGADLVMEVVSDGEENHRLDRETKRDEYAKARIPEYWIVDPEQARITVLCLDGRSYRVLGEFARGDQAVSKLLAGFHVDVTSAVTAKR